MTSTAAPSRGEMVLVPSQTRVVPDAQAQRLPVPVAVDAFLLSATR